MTNAKIKYVIEDAVVLIKAHLLQENEDGTEKYIQPMNVELSFEDFFNMSHKKKTGN